MARGVNKVILVGNLGADPEVRYTSDQRPIANLRIATSEGWKDRNTGEQQERTEWHRVVIFGKLAEIAQQYLRKGQQVYIEGKLQTRKWTGQDNIERYSTEVVVDISGTMQMLGGRGEMGGAVPFNSPPSMPEANSYPSAPSPSPQSTPGAKDSLEDDIPF